MKYSFIWALVALLVSGVQAAEETNNPPPNVSGSVESFETADIDVNGKISKWEFLACEKRKAKEDGRKFDSKAAGDLFDALDTNKDKALSKEEFDHQAGSAEK